MNLDVFDMYIIVFKEGRPKYKCSIV